MPVRSLTSSVLRWPDRDEVEQALTSWARNARDVDDRIVRVGYFGSYATGHWGVGSDLDVVMIVTASDVGFERRAAAWDTTSLPVPTDLLVYTEQEWDRITASSHPAASQTRWV